MVFRSRSLRQHLGAIERRPYFVSAEYVLEWQRMRRRRDLVQVERLDVSRVAEDAAELTSEVLDLVVSQREPREFGDVLDVGR